MEAIRQAAVQVLLKEGKLLTTTRVAARAGVSVGTLYQYFPNKSSLLQSILKEHLDNVAVAVESACKAAHGRPLQDMAASMIAAFVRAKFQHLDASAALYAISDDLEGKRIAKEMHARVIRAAAAMLRTAGDASLPAPETVAEVLLYTMAGVSRGMLEAGPDRQSMAAMQTELTRVAQAYLQASAGRR